MTICKRLTLCYAGIFLAVLIVIGFAIRQGLAGQGQPSAAWGDQDPADPTEGVILIAVVAMAVGLAAGWWCTRRALAPLAALTASLEKVREHNVRRPLPVGDADDELGRLVAIFNQMNERLDASFERLREFTLHTSRELRAPLTLLCGDTEAILRDESLSPTEYDRAVRQLEELRRMTRLVESVTVLTQAGAGQIAVVQKPVRWDELIRDNFGDTLVRAKQFGIRVELSARETVTVLGDRHWLRQLLLALTENAVRFNRAQGNILMVLRQVGEVAEFSIANTGPGIPPEMLPKVFERFVRVGTGLGSTVEGCGLGLSLAEWIVRAHHGTITIESPDAELTTVRVRLPVHAPKV